MKKFTTTFFLLMAMVLLLPTEMRGEEMVLLTNQISGAGYDANNSKIGFTYDESNSRYYYKFTYDPNNDLFSKSSIPSAEMQFRIGIGTWSSDILPNSMDEGVPTIKEGKSNAVYSNDQNKDNVWKVTLVSNTTYTIYVELGPIVGSGYNADNFRVWMTSETSGSGEDISGFEQGSSSNGKSYYLVSEGYGNGTSADNIFAESTTAVLTGGTVHYNRILKFTDNRDGSYSLDIPATITGKVYIEEVNYDGTVTEYRPTEDYSINSTLPAKDGAVSGYLEAGDSYLWSMTDRGCDLDGGLYNITMRLDKKGVPGAWTFTHNAGRRVAYFLSTAEMSSAYPVYDNSLSNQYKGTNYFSKNAHYYVICNVVKNDGDCKNLAKTYDSTLDMVSNITPTVNKLFLLGNGGQDFRTNYTGNEDRDTRANEFSPGDAPMQPTTTILGLAKVEFNPNKASTDGITTETYKHRIGIRGEVQTLDGGSGLTGEEEESMTIIGPLFKASVNADNTWNWKYAAPQRSDKKTNNVMTYNETEHCYMITIVTTEEQQGAHFRFVRNANSTNAARQFGEESSTSTDLARIPYYDASKSGHAATVSDPNEVIMSELNTTEYADKEYKNKKDAADDIMFNRPAGEWTIKFYVTTDTEGKLTGGYYTINSVENVTQEVPVVTVGTEKMIIRTFSYGVDLKPLDEDVHIYVAHNFNKDEKNEETKPITGDVNLYKINYVPAGEGVVLLYTGDYNASENSVKLNFTLANEYNVDNYKESLTDKKYLWTCYAEHAAKESWNNDLVGTLEDTEVLRSDKNEEGEIIARNFAMNLYSNTKTGKTNNIAVDSKDNYLGFFRFEGTSKANYAYLKYKNDDIVGIGGDAQLLHQIMESENPESQSKIAITFEGINDDKVGEVTGIRDLEVEKKSGDSYYYNLQGIRINTPVNGGIYIHNGKKIIVK